MHRGRRTTYAWVAIWVAIAAAGMMLSACSEEEAPTVDRATFGDTMVERFGATEAQADCITGYVFDDYDPSEITVLVDDGMGALPQARWSPYLNAAGACITHDQPLEGGG